MKIYLAKRVYEFILFVDQGLRKIFLKITSPILRRTLWLIIKLSDLFNQWIVYFIIRRLGWPLRIHFGIKSNLAAYYVIMHSDVDVMEKYYPLLRQASKLEKENLKALSSVIDRIRLHKKKEQLFGNETRKINRNGQLIQYIYPIFKRDLVNQRRKKIGLPQTIEEYAKEINAELEYNDTIRLELLRK